jgi:hypothetical protein
MRRWCHVLGCVGVLVLCLFARPVPGQTQELTPNDLKQIAFAAQRGFEHILQLWKDQRSLSCMSSVRLPARWTSRRKPSNATCRTRPGPYSAAGCCSNMWKVVSSRLTLCT